MSKKTKELSDEPVYAIGMAASKLEISVHSFRQYESEGLLIPFKTATGRRYYSELDLEKVVWIKDMLQNQGLNFEGIRRMLAMIPCWKLRNCSDSTKSKCNVIKNRKQACWASDVECAHRLTSCRDCEVYKKIIHCDEILPLIQEV
ncbi:MAG: MerR family transcriptional regulator [bacterium]|nr:MerR family transcriptional regulator [bacterium]